MSPKRDEKDPVRQESERLMEMLRIFVRTLGYGNVEIARLTKLPHANVGRYFRGESRVPLDFVVAVIRALGLEYREFFDLAYAEQPVEPSAARRKIERILEVLPARRAALPVAREAPPPEPAAPPPRVEVERMLEDLRREVAALLEARKADKVIAPPPEPKPEPAKPASKRRKSQR